MQPTSPLFHGGLLGQAGTLASAEIGEATQPSTPLQRLRLSDSAVRRALYWHAHPLAPAQAWADAKLTKAGIQIGPATQLSFDTYFNSFFEAQWHRITALPAVWLQLDIEGAGLLRVYRRALDRRTLLHEQPVGTGTSTFRLPIETTNFRQQGVLSFELVTGEASLTLCGGGWLTDQPPTSHPGLAAVICTFNRETELTRVLTEIDADPVAVGQLARVIVVNQGRPGLGRLLDAAGLSAPLHGKLRLIEQSNFGGAGGFTRGLIAALDDDAVSHVALLDDDIQVDPDSLVRLAALFAFAKGDTVIGGQMLDLLHPTRLYEAGAIISDRHWAFLPQHHTADIANPDTLESLSRPQPVHYNGWWCCAFPLTLVRKYGLPLPCFIRGDDLEYGMRMYSRSVPAISMPGVAVWHEPFYLKFGNWHLYYEIRNMLVTAALHMPADRWPTVRRIGRLTVVHLLTFRYFSTALILAGIRDYLAGPAVMGEEPLARHRRIMQMKVTYPPESTSRSTVLQRQVLKRRPANSAACILLLCYLLLRNGLARERTRPPRIMPANEFEWLNMRGVENVALETWWDEELPVFRRSRVRHRALLREAAVLLLRLWRENPTVRLTWRAAASRLTTPAFWRSYLGLAPRPAKPDEVEQQAA